MIPEYLSFDDKCINYNKELIPQNFINEEYTMLTIKREFAKFNTTNGNKRLYGEYSNIEHFGYPFYVEYYALNKSEKIHKKGFMTIEEAINFYNNLDI